MIWPVTVAGFFYKREYNLFMGLFKVKVRIANPEDITKWKSFELLVDSGAHYSVLSIQDLKDLGIHPVMEERFDVADGRTIRRKVGGGFFEIDGKRGYAPVIFGLKGDIPVLGATALEALCLQVDPIRRRLVPLTLKVLPSVYPPRK